MEFEQDWNGHFNINPDIMSVGQYYLDQSSLTVLKYL